MEYNTTRFKLVIPEYGRNIQKMIDFAIKIKDRKKRNQCALSIIRLMTDSNTNKYNKKIFNYFKHKLWNQLFIMSNYKLDIDTPFPKPNPKKTKNFIKKIVYPEYLNNFRYYGKIIRDMINVAINCKDEKKKEGLLYSIANTMKKNYLRWNKNMVEDDVIFKDLTKLSNGKISITNNNMDPLLQCSKILKRNFNHRIRKQYKNGNF
ncbi:DUF4290 domain-containing protein [Blattabacterium cuenoti]|uniref:DUF4290 domain-containing protein n=1 Tax=Blattabacterium cuenoti TaxID=1653831 RepID=UPI00163C3A02|nr:DUF4290 domain-containing protein [Blattabacterium cuenoti]